jgi:two-component system, chemotaxis family, protein-glutamate methylesterase/glutaminase
MKTGSDDSPRAVVIGASVGAIDALTSILPLLPAEFPAPVLVVVHVPADRKSMLADLFNDRCGMRVKEAEDKEIIEAGTVYFAPSDYHLLVEPDFSISLSSDEPVHYSRPAIDVLFETAADAYGDGLVGVILTGANRDGANGLRQVADEGGLALVQAPYTAEGQTMPNSALATCATARALTLPQIAEALNQEFPIH